MLAMSCLAFSYFCSQARCKGSSREAQARWECYPKALHVNGSSSPLQTKDLSGDDQEDYYLLGVVCASGHYRIKRKKRKENACICIQVEFTL